MEACTALCIDEICGKYKKQVHHLSIKNFGFREEVLHLLFFM